MKATDLQIEAAARAICEVWGYDWDGPPGDDQTPPDVPGEDDRPSKQPFRESALAALQSCKGEK